MRVTHEPPPQASGLQRLRQQLFDRAQEHPEGSPVRRDLLAKLELSDEALVEDVLANVDANADRIGCPGQPVLIELAARTRPLTDVAWDHVLQCSPCSSEVRRLHEHIRSAERRRVWAAWAVAAVVVLLVASSLWWWRNGAAGQPRVTIAQLTPTTVDLRTYTVSRSDSTDRRPPIRLPSGRLRLRMLLPVGFDPGSYELQVLDRTLQSHAATAGVATMQGTDTTLSADVDLTALPSGTYQLAIRRTGEDWQLFPVRLN
jgi:hypothetical protein